jgi:integrase
VATITDLRKSNDPAKQRSKRPWLLRYRDHTGKQRAESFTRKADAETRKTEVERAKQTGRLDTLDSGDQTLAQVMRQWFAAHANDFATSTRKQHAYIWNAVVLGEPEEGATGTGTGADKKPKRAYKRAAIVDMPVKSIRRSHVQTFKNDTIADNVPRTSVTLALSLISRALDFATDEDMIPANPARGVKPPKPPAKGDVYCATPKEVEAIRAQLGERDAAMVSLMAYGGMRPQELRAIDTKHVMTKTLRLEFAMDDAGKTKRLKGTDGAGRSVPLCDAIRDDLAALDWKRGLLVLTDDGRPTTKTWWGNWRNRVFMPAVKAAGVPITRPYDLRHSCASMWLREGVDSATVAKRLGHSLAVLLRTYAHVIDDLDPDDRRKMDELIAEARA